MGFGGLRTGGNAIFGASIAGTMASSQALRDTRVGVAGPIVDIHRHCIPDTSGILAGLMGSIAEMRMNMVETKEISSDTVKGITSIIYPEMKEIDAQVRCQDEAGVTLSILSFSMGLETLCQALYFVPDAVVTRQFNDACAEMVSRYPGKLAFMIAVNPFDRSAIAECQRCFKAYNAKGISIGTSWNANFLDDELLEPLWEYAQEQDAAIFLHPPLVPIAYPQMNAYRLEEMIGRPFDTTLTVVRMIYSGVFDRHPGLKIVLPHMGAALPNLAGRLDFGYRLGYKGLPDGQAAVCRKKPSAYFRTNLYVDTMGFSQLGVRYAIETFGMDNVLFGTDYAAVSISQREHVEIIRTLNLSKTDEAKVLWKNADKIFKLRL
jgi:aminocarboxymuconate-semialdehyde decarboxylase